MLFCNLTPLAGRVVNVIVLCWKSKFCEYITSLHIQHSIYERQIEFFVFSMTQIASKFCNVSFAGQYISFLQLKVGLLVKIKKDFCLITPPPFYSSKSVSKIYCLADIGHSSYFYLFQYKSHIPKVVLKIH